MSAFRSATSLAISGGIGSPHSGQRPAQSGRQSGCIGSVRANSSRKTGVRSSSWWSSMARTTGYTCTAMVGLIAKGLWKKPGLATPETVGRDRACYDAVIAHLKGRGVHLFERVEELGD